MNNKKKGETLDKDELALAPKKLQVFLTSTAYTLVSIATFGGLGYMLDQRFETKSLYLIIGLIIGYPIAQLIIYRSIKKISLSNTLKQQ